MMMLEDRTPIIDHSLQAMPAVQDNPENNSKTLSKVAVVAALCLIVASFHFLTPVHLHKYHLIFDRLGYVPILIAAYWFGFRGGMLAAAGIALAHFLHIWLQWGGQFLSANLHQTLEVFMYLAVGAVTGVLSESLLRATRRLSRAYQDLRTKTEEVLSAEERLRRTERIQALAELSAGIAHEIRNPLASIKGAAEILASPSLTAERREEFSTILAKESKHLNDVVSEFLDFAHPKNHEPGHSSLPVAIDGVLELTVQQRQKRDIRLEKEYAADLPTIFFDRSQLRQVFANLISNAIEAMPEGGLLRVSCRPGAAGELICSVEDTGNGIPERDLPRVFDPFYTTRSNGTGLGLSIVHKILSHYHCTIEASNQPEGGARFTLCFPPTQEPEA